MDSNTAVTQNKERIRGKTKGSANPSTPAIVRDHLVMVFLSDSPA